MLRVKASGSALKYREDCVLRCLSLFCSGMKVLYWTSQRVFKCNLLIHFFPHCITLSCTLVALPPTGPGSQVSSSAQNWLWPTVLILPILSFSSFILQISVTIEATPAAGKVTTKKHWSPVQKRTHCTHVQYLSENMPCSGEDSVSRNNKCPEVGKAMPC